MDLFVIKLMKSITWLMKPGPKQNPFFPANSLKHSKDLLAADLVCIKLNATSGRTSRETCPVDWKNTCDYMISRITVNLPGSQHQIFSQCFSNVQKCLVRISHCSKCFTFVPLEKIK